MADVLSPQIAFSANEETPTKPKVAVHVNFGVFTGREATLAEIDRLAAWLLDRVPHVTIVSEIRHEIDRHSEAAVHQVRIEVPPHDVKEPPEQLEGWLVDQAERWARQCHSERSVGPGAAP
jgi:hypothetical protein